MSLSGFKKKYIDFTLVGLLAAFYAMFNIVLIAKVYYMQLQNYGGEQDFSWPNFLMNHILLDYVIVVTYMVIVAISTKRFLNKNYSWVKIISIHTVFSLLIGMVIRLMFDFYSIIIGRSSFEDYSFKESIFGFMYVIDLNFLIYFAMVFIIYTYYYLKQVKEAEKRHAKLETQLVNTRMKMLSAQLQPHFLFNTLNSISVLTDIDAGKAKDTIADLSDFLREILYNSERNRIDVEKELQILEYYLNIVNVRFSDHLKITQEIDPAVMSRRIPALLLQPVIENSIKHGYSYNHTNLNIHIKIYTEKNFLIVLVENDGEKLSVDQKELMKKGVGLSNINDRLKNLYGDDYIFIIRNKMDGHGVETIIKIPE